MEAVEDPAINRVAISGNTACIFDLVDPVQTPDANNSWFYYIGAFDPLSQSLRYVPVADFVYPNFFTSSGPGFPFDVTGIIQSPFQTSPNYRCGTIFGSIPGLNTGLGQASISRAHKAPTFSLPTSFQEFELNGVHCRRGKN